MVELESSHGSNSHASVTFDDISTSWQRYTATLTARATDTTARLAVKLQVRRSSPSAAASSLTGQRISVLCNRFACSSSIGETMRMPAIAEWNLDATVKNAGFGRGIHMDRHFSW